MKLCPKEFEAMQMGWRKWYIREIELRTFKKFGLWIKDRDILEVGCGSGYASSLITWPAKGTCRMPALSRAVRTISAPSPTGALTRCWTSASCITWRAGGASLTSAAGC